MIKTPSQFLTTWRASYPQILPIGTLLHDGNFKGRWMRIHSLPLSKRYPDTKAEWDIMLHRQNSVIDYLIPEGSDIEVVINWIEADTYLFQSQTLMPLGLFQEGVGEPAYDSYLMEANWARGGLDQVLIMIADEALRGFIIGPDCLIKPYDGGMDVIARDADSCHALKRQFKDWLSARPDGL
jgi:hypothetical protein